MTQDTKIVDGIKNINKTTQKTLNSIKNARKVEETLENFLDQQQKLEREDLESMGLKLKTHPQNYNRIDNRFIIENIIDTKRVCAEAPTLPDKVCLDEVASLSLGKEVGVVYPPVENAAQQIQPTNQMPEKWRTLKIDLFNNTKDPLTNPYDYKLAMSIYLYNKCEQNNYDETKPVVFQTKFNRTNLDLFNRYINKSDPHYAMARRIRDEVKINEVQQGIEHISLNKFYRPATASKIKQAYTVNLSGMLTRNQEFHTFWLMLQEKVYVFDLLPTQLTAKQKKVGIIATHIWRAEDSLHRSKDDASEYLL